MLKEQGGRKNENHQMVAESGTYTGKKKKKVNMPEKSRKQKTVT